MTVIAFIFSVFFAALGAMGLVWPAKLLRLEEYFRRPPARYIASVIRLLMGAALFFAAPGSRAPGVLRALGVFIFVAGVITLFLGPERFRRLVDWWSAHGPRFARIWAALAFVLGVFLAYALVA
jgi:uncharacterized membrane protein YidH (DUF202 family)